MKPKALSAVLTLALLLPLFCPEAAAQAPASPPPGGTSPAPEAGPAGIRGEGKAEDPPELGGALGSVIRLKTKGGGAFQGSLFGIGGDRIEILDGEGQIIQVARREIDSFELIDPSRDPAVYFQDAAANRLIVMPTGFGMERGSLHITSQEIAAVTASYGLGERVSLWGGVSIPGAIASLRYATPVGESAALSLGSFLGATWVDPVGAAIPYLIASFGQPNRNLTLGLGAAFTLSAFQPLNLAAAIAAIGGKFPVSRGACVVTESWILALSGGGSWSGVDILALPSAVFRIAGSRLSWDIGALLPLTLSNRAGWRFGGIEGGPVIPLPILSITYRIR